MSPPRTPLARRGPGLLAATTLRVLAAEMSDAGRLARGRRLRADGAVVDLAVGHGAVVARVQGSLAVPYVVTLEARPGHRAPSRRELTVRCTCADDTGTGQQACKHAVAALLGLADEVTVEPELLARWRRSSEASETSETSETSEASEASETDAPAQVHQHPLSVLMQAPGPLPPLPLLPALHHPPFPDPLLDEVLTSARAELHVHWD